MMLNKEQEALEGVNFDNLRKFNEKIRDFFLNQGIMLKETRVKALEDNRQKADSDNVLGWLRDFQVDTEKTAFYLSINKKSDLEDWMTQIINKLNVLKDEFDNFLQQNEASLDDVMIKKIQHFISLILKVRKPLRIKNMNLSKEIEECNDIDDMQYKIAAQYASFLRERFFEPVVEPIYEGMKEKPQDTYRWMIKTINNFIASLGIKTVVLQAGDKIDIEKYEPTEESANNITHDEALKEIVKEVVCYAYVFKGEEEDFPIMPGKALVWAYRKE